MPKPLSVVRLRWQIAGPISFSICAMASGGYPTEISDVGTGNDISVVGRLLSFDPSHEAHMMKDVHKGMTFYYCGLLEAGFETYTDLDGNLTSQFPVPRISAGKTTKILCHAVPSWDDFHKLIDTCSGLGGVSHRAQSVGFYTTVAVDANPKMTDLHRVHSDAEVVTSDIGSHSVIHETWIKAEGAATVAGGFSCQPFSLLGARRGGSDPRASSPPSLLQAAYLLQVKAVMLECVLPAKQDPFVNASADHFIAVTGFNKGQVDLRLENVWPYRRGRSWWLLTSPVLGVIDVTSWPKIDSIPTIGHIIPELCRWDPRDGLALKLDPVENEAFGIESGLYSRYFMCLWVANPSLALVAAEARQPDLPSSPFWDVSACKG